MRALTRFYKKSEIWFAVTWIIVYVIGTSVCDRLSEAIGSPKLMTALFHAALCAVIAVWLRRNRLRHTFGLCRSGVRPYRMLFYTPLAVIASCNLWSGAGLQMPVDETILYVASMLMVGFLEEVIFRGFLFQAMRKDSLRSAVIVTSLTFGIGHIVNLFNGSGAKLVENLCQVCYAVSVGFVFVIVLIKCGSLWPCILTHSALNALSAIASEHAHPILVSLALCVISIAYAVFLIRTIRETEISQREGAKEANA